MTAPRIVTAITDRIWARTRPRIERIFYANGGIGDELMLTAIAAAARAAGRPIHVLAAYPEIWRGNRDAASVETDLERWLYAERRRWIATNLVHLSCRNGIRRHLAAQMADHVGVALPAGWRPVFYVQPVQRNRRRLVVQNSCRGARYTAVTKEWPQERWTALCALLAQDFELVQLGTNRDPLIRQATDLRNRTTLAGAADCLAGAALFIGLESGLMHLAAAVRTPSVIIYGGRTRPNETGYAFNRNLTREPSCAGCGLNVGCPHELMCLDIPVNEVATAVREVLSGSEPSHHQ